MNETVSSTPAFPVFNKTRLVLDDGTAARREMMTCFICLDDADFNMPSLGISQDRNPVSLKNPWDNVPVEFLSFTWEDLKAARAVIASFFRWLPAALREIPPELQFRASHASNSK